MLIVYVDVDAHFWIFNVFYFIILSMYKEELLLHGSDGDSLHEYIVFWPNNKDIGVVFDDIQLPDESLIVYNDVEVDVVVPCEISVIGLFR
jgi:hypothetical protein